MKDYVILVNKKNDLDLIYAFFSTKDNLPCNEVELKEYLEKKITSYMMPKKYLQVENFPLCATGKIDKNKSITVGQ